MSNVMTQRLIHPDLCVPNLGVSSSQPNISPPTRSSQISNPIKTPNHLHNTSQQNLNLGSTLHKMSLDFDNNSNHPKTVPHPNSTIKRSSSIERLKRRMENYKSHAEKSYQHFAASVDTVNNIHTLETKALHKKFIEANKNGNVCNPNLSSTKKSTSSNTKSEGRKRSIDFLEQCSNDETSNNAKKIVNQSKPLSDSAFVNSKNDDNDCDVKPVFIDSNASKTGISGNSSEHLLAIKNKLQQKSSAKSRKKSSKTSTISSNIIDDKVTTEPKVKREPLSNFDSIVKSREDTGRPEFKSEQNLFSDTMIMKPKVANVDIKCEDISKDLINNEEKENVTDHSLHGGVLNDCDVPPDMKLNNSDSVLNTSLNSLKSGPSGEDDIGGEIINSELLDDLMDLNDLPNGFMDNLDDITSATGDDNNAEVEPNGPNESTIEFESKTNINNTTLDELDTSMLAKELDQYTRDHQVKIPQSFLNDTQSDVSRESSGGYVGERLSTDTCSVDERTSTLIPKSGHGPNFEQNHLSNVNQSMYGPPPNLHRGGGEDQRTLFTNQSQQQQVSSIVSSMTNPPSSALSNQMTTSDQPHMNIMAPSSKPMEGGTISPTYPMNPQPLQQQQQYFKPSHSSQGGAGGGVVGPPSGLHERDTSSQSLVHPPPPSIANQSEMMMREQQHHQQPPSFNYRPRHLMFPADNMAVRSGFIGQYQSSMMNMMGGGGSLRYPPMMGGGPINGSSPFIQQQQIRHLRGQVPPGAATMMMQHLPSNSTPNRNNFAAIPNMSSNALPVVGGNSAPGVGPSSVTPASNNSTATTSSSNSTTTNKRSRAGRGRGGGSSGSSRSKSAKAKQSMMKNIPEGGDSSVLSKIPNTPKNLISGAGDMSNCPTIPVQHPSPSFQQNGQLSQGTSSINDSLINNNGSGIGSSFVRHHSNQTQNCVVGSSSPNHMLFNSGGPQIRQNDPVHHGGGNPLMPPSFPQQMTAGNFQEMRLRAHHASKYRLGAPRLPPQQQLVGSVTNNGGGGGMPPGGPGLQHPLSSMNMTPHNNMMIQRMMYQQQQANNVMPITSNPPQQKREGISMNNCSPIHTQSPSNQSPLHYGESHNPHHRPDQNGSSSPPKIMNNHNNGQSGGYPQQNRQQHAQSLIPTSQTQPPLYSPSSNFQNNNLPTFGGGGQEGSAQGANNMRMHQQQQLNMTPPHLNGYINHSSNSSNQQRKNPQSQMEGGSQFLGNVVRGSASMSPSSSSPHHQYPNNNGGPPPPHQTSYSPHSVHYQSPSGGSGGTGRFAAGFPSTRPSPGSHDGFSPSSPSSFHNNNNAQAPSKPSPSNERGTATGIVSSPLSSSSPSSAAGIGGGGMHHHQHPHRSPSVTYIGGGAPSSPLQFYNNTAPAPSSGAHNHEPSSSNYLKSSPHSQFSNPNHQNVGGIVPPPNSSPHGSCFNSTMMNHPSQNFTQS